MKPAGAGLHVFVLVDALGWNLLPAEGFLRDLLPFQKPLRTILGFSSGAIPTLLTGAPPRVHGHWNLWAYDPSRSRFGWLRRLEGLPPGWLENRYARRLIRQAGRWLLGAGPGFECDISPRLLPWLRWVEDRNLYRPGGIAGISTAFDHWRRRGVDFRIYSYRDGWRGASDAAILARAERDVARSRATVFFVYLSGLDHFLHLHRREETAVRRRLETLAAQLRRLFAAVRRRDPAAEITVASDHGMAPVEHHCDLAGAVAELGFQMPRDYLAVYDSTMARFWFSSAAARQAIPARLAELDCGRMLTNRELREEGLDFADQRFGEVIFLLLPRWLAARSDFHGRGWEPSGMHGYDPADADSDAVLLSNIRPPGHTTHIAGMYELLLRPLGAPAEAGSATALEWAGPAAKAAS